MLRLFFFFFFVSVVFSHDIPLPDINNLLCRLEHLHLFDQLGNPISVEVGVGTGAALPDDGSGIAHYITNVGCPCPDPAAVTGFRFKGHVFEHASRVFWSVEGSPFVELTVTNGDFEVPLFTLAPGQPLKFVIRVRCDCVNDYVFDCTPPPSTGSVVVADPQFVGLMGQQYQVHGVTNQIYSIISDPWMQLNSRFVFLSQGQCPIINNERAEGCWSHPGTYLGELGLSTIAGDRVHIVSGPAFSGFSSVSVNGRSLMHGDVCMLAGSPLGNGMIALNGTHQITLQYSSFAIDVENSDMYVNQRIRVTNWATLNNQAHGLLGQTWNTAQYENTQLPEIQGQIDDYVIQDNSLFSNKFVFNKFNAIQQ